MEYVRIYLHSLSTTLFSTPGMQLLSFFMNLDGDVSYYHVAVSQEHCYRKFFNQIFCFISLIPYFPLIFKKNYVLPSSGLFSILEISQDLNYPCCSPLKKNLHQVDITHFNQCYKQVFLNSILKLL